MAIKKETLLCLSRVESLKQEMLYIYFEKEQKLRMIKNYLSTQPRAEGKNTKIT